MTRREKLEEIRDRLIDFAMALVEAKIRYYLRRKKIRECDADDLRQEAMVAVLEKLDEYDAKRKACRKTYVHAIVDNSFYYYFLEARRLRNQFHEDIDNLDEEDEPLTNVGGSNGMTETELVNLRLDLLTFRTGLTEQQQSVFDLMGDYSQSEIARRLGMAQSRVSGIYHEIREAAENSTLKNYF